MNGDVQRSIKAMEEANNEARNITNQTVRKGPRKQNGKDGENLANTSKGATASVTPETIRASILKKGIAHSIQMLPMTGRIVFGTRRDIITSPTISFQKLVVTRSGTKG